MVHVTYFVHGTTTDNEQGIATGWLPGRLSTRGEIQATELGFLVDNKNYNVIFCSDLERAVDSANLAFRSKYQIIQDDRLRECNYGELNGTPKDFMNEMDKHIERPFPGGESYHEVEKRMRSFVDFLRLNYNGQSIGIVAHQAPQLALEVILNGKSWGQAMSEDWRHDRAWRPGWEYIIQDTL